VVETMQELAARTETLIAGEASQRTRGHPHPVRLTRVVAKGQGFIAQRIREEAEKHNVPIVRDVPLALTLHAGCKLGQSIPADLYEAVARLLAFVFSLRRGVA
jgi:flagellar biosynthesis protein FlhB